MASDDEEELLPEPVSSYCFDDREHTPVCFSVLPYSWNNGGDGATAKQIFVSGLVDSGLRRIYRQVVAWRMELGGVKPRMHVLTKENIWMELCKPRKSYEDVCRKSLVMVHCLHYLRRNLDAPYKAMRGHVDKVFSRFELKPSIFDLRDHVRFIREYLRKDKELQKSQLLLKILDKIEKKLLVRKEHGNIKNPDFIDDDTDAGQDSNNDGYGECDEEQDCFDSVCSICDDGGVILSCEGPCLRSFHATKESGVESNCKTLQFAREEVEAMPRFLCKNCLYKKHQCFHCGELGSSDKSDAPEVFACVAATCGRFYHPECVARLLHPQDKMKAIEEDKRIRSGQHFVCPVHSCHACKQTENRKIMELQFAICRRCPKSYHRKCLPKSIQFQFSENVDAVRAWDNLLRNRILIFCMSHKIDKILLTPSRDHIKFPNDEYMKQANHLPIGDVDMKMKNVNERLQKLARDTKVTLHSSPVIAKPILKAAQFPTGHSGRSIVSDVTKKLPGLSDPDKFSLGKSKNLISEKLSHPFTQTISFQSSHEGEPGRCSKSLLSVSLIEKRNTPSYFPVDAETRIMSLIKNSSSYSLTLENFIKEKDIPSTHAYSAKFVDRTITRGKVEASVEAIVTALEMISKGNFIIEHAKAVCEPGILFQMLKWKSKLSVYLGPFLHGMLYTSFGRHFTKVEKLREIVERLHWYVKSGDTIVDFCCGANDFSILLKDKLEATNKECFYRNYDLIPPKNDFNFVQSDWMKVPHGSFPDGSQLIIGLNPPFGVKGALANKFINKALEFKPKLLILIVPKETQRLDEKKGYPYDLIWVDDQELAGKSFYLPGTVDANNKQLEDWNIDAPPLYLWSRRDWSNRHIKIAENQAHIVRPSDAQKLTTHPFGAAFCRKRKFSVESAVSTTVPDSSAETNINKRHKFMQDTRLKLEIRNGVIPHSNEIKQCNEAFGSDTLDASSRVVNSNYDHVEKTDESFIQSVAEKCSLPGPRTSEEILGGISNGVMSGCYDDPHDSTYCIQVQNASDVGPGRQTYQPHSHVLQSPNIAWLPHVHSPLLRFDSTLPRAVINRGGSPSCYLDSAAPCPCSSPFSDCSHHSYPGAGTSGWLDE